jgi:hypothetical protein
MKTLLSFAEIAGMAPLPDLPDYLPAPTIVFVGAHLPMQKHCSWCDEETGIKHQGNVSHGICLLHLTSNLAHALGKDSTETLFYAVLCQLATEAR